MKQELEEKSSVFFETDDFFQLKAFLNKQSFDKLILLVDENTYIHCLPKLKINFTKKNIIIIPAGEIHKEIKTLNYIWEQLLLKTATRKSILIHLGGGVVSDIGGFAAATFMRGIRFINVPTTLLSMVDASIGGKNAIDFASVKNLIGSFQKPMGVFIYDGFLQTLSTRELRSGFAEMLKHGLIFNKDHFYNLKQAYQKNNRNIEHIPNIKELIKVDITIKNSIVLKDPLENGIRKILNFGHSIGHGLESYFLRKPSPLLHGESIAIGMICEAFLSKKYNSLNQESLVEISDLLLNIYGKTKLKKVDFDLILERIKHDKKNENKTFLFSLLKEIGISDFNIPITESDILDSLTYYQSL